MKRVINYYDVINFDNIENMWNIVKRTCKNKSAVMRYSINTNTNNYLLYKQLLNKSYKPYKYNCFLIFEPKPRLVMSQTIQDKIVNHFVANYYLINNLENKLIDSNIATRKNKGSSYGDKLIRDYVNTIRQKEPDKDIYVLKIDISKYFYNINHEILINMLEHNIKDNNIINIIKIILNETNESYINEKINYLNNKYHVDIPLYEYDVGLSIGAETSQFLAIYYLNNLDHYIKEVLRCKYYIRYMDDYIILNTDKDRLKEVYKEIKVELDKLKLKINPKSNIYNLKYGINFLGYNYRIVNNRFIINYKKETYKRINKKLDNLKSHDLLKYYRSKASYYGFF